MKKRAPAPEYMIRHEGRTFGPYTRADLEAGARDGKITRRDAIHASNTNRWTPAGRVEWLVDAKGRRIRSPGPPAWIVVVAVLQFGAMGVAFWGLATGRIAVPKPTATTIPEATEETAAADPPPGDEPKAVLTATPRAGPGSEAAPLEVRVSARGSVSAGGAIVRYDWDLDGDGSYELTTTMPDPPQTLALSAPGTHRVGVEVTDASGRSATAEAAIRVEGAPPTDDAAQVAKLRSLLEEERGRKAWWLGRIDLRAKNGIVSPASDEEDRAYVEAEVQPVIDRLLAELEALGAAE